MVKAKRTGKRTARQGGRAKLSDTMRHPKITADTPHTECSERLTAFRGLLALVKFLDLIGFEELFAEHYADPKREPKLGSYRMMLGIVMLLFIGFQRLGQFAYIRTDSMLCGILRVGILPAVSTFWRYLTSLTINQSASRLKLGAALRAKVWELCGYAPRRVTVNIDTTVSTVYGAIEGARKGHTPSTEARRGLRRVLCFLAETRDYLCGTQRRGETMSSGEVARQILQFSRLLPEVVREVPEAQRITMPDHTIRIARLKMLLVAAKIRLHSNRDEVCYSVHEQRAAGLGDFLDYLDVRRKEAA